MTKPTPKGRNDSHETDYTLITDHIYVGSNLCKGEICPLHGPEFKKLGICVEINMDDEKKEIPPDEIEGYFWIPVVDGYAPSQMQLDMGVAVIDHAVKQDKKVYVHCRNGHGRSPTMVAAYLVRHKGMTPEKANEFIMEKRPEIHIEDTQMEALREFAKHG